MILQSDEAEYITSEIIIVCDECKIKSEFSSEDLFFAGDLYDADCQNCDNTMTTGNHHVVSCKVACMEVTE